MSLRTEPAKCGEVPSAQGVGRPVFVSRHVSYLQVVAAERRPEQEVTEDEHRAGFFCVTRTRCSGLSTA